MKKFYSFLCIAAMLFAVQACDDDDDPVKNDSTSSSTEQGGSDSGSTSGSTSSASLSVSPSTLSFDEDGGSKTVTLTLNGEDTWTAVPDATWITVSPSSGTASTAVTVTVGENYSETGAERVGSIIFGLAGSSSKAGITVNQTGGVELPDGYYFYEDFEWLAPYAEAGGAADVVGDSSGNAGTAPRIDQTSYGSKTVREALLERGYQFKRWKWDESTDADGVETTTECIFICKNYLKMGKQDYQAGIVLYPLTEAVPSGTNVELVFDWSPQMKDSGKMDVITLTAYVTNGSDIKEYPIPEHEIPNGTMQWVTATVDLTGVTLDQNTVIEILPDQRGLHWSTEDRGTEGGGYSTWRFFIDNIFIREKGK